MTRIYVHSPPSSLAAWPLDLLALGPWLLGCECRQRRFIQAESSTALRNAGTTRLAGLQVSQQTFRGLTRSLAPSFNTYLATDEYVCTCSMPSASTGAARFRAVQPGSRVSSPGCRNQRSTCLVRPETLLSSWCLEQQMSQSASSGVNRLDSRLICSGGQRPYFRRLDKSCKRSRLASAAPSLLSSRFSLSLSLSEPCMVLYIPTQVHTYYVYT